MNRLLACSALFACCISSSAAFAEGGQGEPPLPPVVLDTAYDWSGAYVGGSFALSVEQQILSVPTGIAIVGSSPENDFTGGVFAGYRWQRDAFVYGVEASYSYGESTSDLSGGGGNGGGGAPISARLAMTNDATTQQISLVGRAGYAFDRFLVSGFAGVTNFNVDTTLGGESSVDGYLYGVGVDYAVTDHISLGAEYSRTRIDFDNPFGTIEQARDIFSVRLAYNF